MRNSKTMLATIALGAALAIGSATMASAAGGHMGGSFGSGHGSMTTPFFLNHGGGRSFAGHPFAMNNGGYRGMGMRRGHNGFDGRHNGFHRRHDHDDFAFLGLGPFWSDPYGACDYDPVERAYLWRHGVRYYCP